ncbi:MAG: hypothetical protein RSF82_03890 [Angelakisella sp.]
MSMKKDTGTSTSAVGTVAKSTGLAALRAVFLRRHVIIGCAAAAAAAFMLFVLIPLLPRTAKPVTYRAGELEISAITEVIGYRKLLAMSESLSGLGRAEAGEYCYKAGKNPKDDVEKYLNLLTEEYGAVAAEDAQLGENDGTLTLILPTETEDREVELTIRYDSEQYRLSIDEKTKAVKKPEKVEALITPEEARNILLTLTKAETGFKSDISVYTSKLEEETVNVDGWDYYVFTVVADYSATRVEYRGTFYISCNDGAVLRYDKETDTTSRIKRD